VVSAVDGAVMSAAMSRVLCWFSCGATSAVATKLALADYPDAEIYYCDTGSEHHDNLRFLFDCQKWYGRRINIVRSDKYESAEDVWRTTKYLVGRKYARCTLELKKKVRQSIELPDDTHVYGFDAGESKRVERFRQYNPEITIKLPLVERGLTKNDCLGVLTGAGIEIPMMYRLGFSNANCIGCPKGGRGYWAKIRRVFPEHFDRMVQTERELGIKILKDRKDGKNERIWLSELPIDEPEDGGVSADCGLFCGGV